MANQMMWAIISRDGPPCKPRERMIHDLFSNREIARAAFVHGEYSGNSDIYRAEDGELIRIENQALDQLGGE